MDTMKRDVLQTGLAAKAASEELAQTSGRMRNDALQAMADALAERADEILAANGEDYRAASEAGTAAPLLDRLLLDDKRIASMSAALCSLAELDDPIGRVLEKRTLYNGIELSRISVPIGVVAIVYEARPNVTADASGLCIKTGNACILRGGSMAMRSVLAMTEVLSDAITSVGLPADAIQAISDVSHEATFELMGLHGIVDLLIPRGGAGLIHSCVENSKVPVIETGTGNCHIYLERTADPDKALAICVNAKTQRPGVCNAAESLLVDDAIADSILPAILKALSDKGVCLHCDEHSLRIAREADIISAVPADEDDWGREYLDLDMSVKCVSGTDEAIDHINRYGTRHSESIISEDEKACEVFLKRVDAAAVYSNASTRFTDGEEFGLGAEVGISTQKLHARGPMGLDALCSYKYQLRGAGQIRG